ncbi:12163_t:CDS:2, partial [Dentiscutata erythropus]
SGNRSNSNGDNQCLENGSNGNGVNKKHSGEGQGQNDNQETPNKKSILHIINYSAQAKN